MPYKKRVDPLTDEPSDTHDIVGELNNNKNPPAENKLIELVNLLESESRESQHKKEFWREYQDLLVWDQNEAKNEILCTILNLFLKKRISPAIKFLFRVDKFIKGNVANQKKAYYSVLTSQCSDAIKQLDITAFLQLFAGDVEGTKEAFHIVLSSRCPDIIKQLNIKSFLQLYAGNIKGTNKAYYAILSSLCSEAIFHLIENDERAFLNFLIVKENNEKNKQEDEQINRLQSLASSRATKENKQTFFKMAIDEISQINPSFLNILKSKTSNKKLKALLNQYESSLLPLPISWQTSIRETTTIKINLKPIMKLSQSNKKTAAAISTQFTQPVSSFNSPLPNGPIDQNFINTNFLSIEYVTKLLELVTLLESEPRDFKYKKEFWREYQDLLVWDQNEAKDEILCTILNLFLKKRIKPAIKFLFRLDKFIKGNEVDQKKACHTVLSSQYSEAIKQLNIADFLQLYTGDVEGTKQAYRAILSCQCSEAICHLIEYNEEAFLNFLIVKNPHDINKQSDEQLDTLQSLASSTADKKNKQKFFKMAIDEISQTNPAFLTVLKSKKSSKKLEKLFHQYESSLLHLTNELAEKHKRDNNNKNKRKADNSGDETSQRNKRTSTSTDMQSAPITIASSFNNSFISRDQSTTAMPTPASYLPANCCALPENQYSDPISSVWISDEAIHTRPVSLFGSGITLFESGAVNTSSTSRSFHQQIGLVQENQIF